MPAPSTSPEGEMHLQDLFSALAVICCNEVMTPSFSPQWSKAKGLGSNLTQPSQSLVSLAPETSLGALLSLGKVLPCMWLAQAQSPTPHRVSQAPLE